ncbi:MAG: type II secretion system F family protein [Vulcanimicrobiota bacterium]
MPRFVYDALDYKGRAIQGEVTAPDIDTVVADLQKIRYTVTNVREKSEVVAKLGNVLGSFQRVSFYALAVFTRQLATLLDSGIPMLRAVQGLTQQNLNDRLTRAVVSLHKDLKEGFALSRALSRQPDVFSPIYVAMVRAGEMSGAMDEMLTRLANLLEREFRLRKKVQAATTYPLVVFSICMLVTFFLVNHIFPTFINLFRGLSVELPPTTRALITITETMNNPMVVIPTLLGLVAALFLLSKYFKTPIGRRQWSWLMLELPWLGDVNRKVAMTRMCRTLGTLIDSGIPMLHSLQIVAFSVGNAVLSDILEEIQGSMKTGMHLSLRMADYRIFPPMLVHMTKVGEETGNMSKMLSKLAGFFDEEVEYSLQAFTSLIEPVMIVCMGTLVLFVLVAVFQPIYSLMGQF